MSDQRCEPDIGRSPFLDPAIEPDVWLAPGGSADLSVGQMAPECAEPSLVKLVQLGIGEESAVVPTVVLTCGWWLDAFVPIEPIRDGCSWDQLSVVAVGSTVVIRNDSPTACGISGVVGAGDAPLVEPDPGIDARELMPGDVALIGRSNGDDCDTAPQPVELVDEVAGVVVVDDVPCDVVFDSRTARPWYGTSSGPTAGLQAGVVDTDAALAVLDPFAAT